MVDVIRISFELTRTQRALNPPESLICAILGILCGLMGLLVVVLRPLSVVSWALLGAMALLLWLFFRRSIRSILNSLFGSAYINTLIIQEDGSVHFGIDKPDIVLLFSRSIRVSKGVCGTTLLSHPGGYSITIPRAAVSIKALRAALLGDKNGIIRFPLNR
jgi:hypothetical protein